MRGPLNRFGLRASPAELRKEIAEKYPNTGELLDLFVENDGQGVHKWHHYLEKYERHFAPFRGKKLRFLEIGVSAGGSLALWRKYFGPDALIYGVDINEECAKLNGLDGQVRIGSQADPEFLKGVVAEMGGVDLVLDDGSHVMEHIEISLKTLFPLLSDGGVYMIEDLHTAYMRGFGGGHGMPGNFFQSVRELADDMHQWYHDKGLSRPEVSGALTGIHMYDSIVVLDKGLVHEPRHSVVKGKTALQVPPRARKPVSEVEVKE